MKKKSLSLLVILILLLASSCQLKNSTGSDVLPKIGNSSSATATSQVDQESPTSSNLTATPQKAGGLRQLITSTLALRQVKITLEDRYPDGKLMRALADVDAEGNYHLVKTYASGDESALANSQDQLDAYIIDGSGYYPNDSGEWVQYSGADVAAQLEDLLRGADGPGLWLDMLPATSYTLKETGDFNGFESKKFQIAGEINGIKVSGAIILESKTLALLEADLTLPDELLHPESPSSTPTTIHLEVNKNDVSSFVVDESRVVQPTEEAANGEQSATTESSNNGNSQSEFPVYEGAENVQNINNMMMYMITASVEDVGQFYRDQLPELGYEAGDEQNNSGMIMQTWTKEGKSYTIVIMPSGTATSVVIQPEE